MHNRKRAFEWWETKPANAEVTSQAIQPIAKSLINRDGPMAPIVIHGSLGLKFYLLQEGNATADCLENQFTPHDLF